MHRFLFISGVVSSLFCAAAGWAQPPESSALADYVHRDDGAYNYSLVNKVSRGASDVYFMHLTSQEWDPTSNASTSVQENRKLWQHEVAIVVPKVVRSSTASLYITGGENSIGGLDRFNYFGTVGPNGSFNRSEEVAGLQAFAEATGSVVTILNQTPNQGILFNNEQAFDSDGRPIVRSEDQLIAKTIRNFVDGNGQDKDWPLLLPMTKSAVRAMDMTQDFVRSQAGGSGFFSNAGATPNVQDFIVSGASKRGWTTWLTAAVDDRVKAIVPIVFDALNLGNQLENQKAIYSRVTNDLTTKDSSGAQFSGSLQPYISSSGPIFVPDSSNPPRLVPQLDPNAPADMNLTVDFGTTYGRQALGIVDPFQYRDAYTMPKYILNSAGDEFFAVNSSNNYFHDLPGEKYLWYVPNTSHGITNNADAVPQILESYTAFYGAIKSGEALPEYDYALLNDGKTIRVEFKNGLLPDDISLWYNDGFRNPITGESEPDFRRGGVRDVGPDGVRSTWFQWDADTDSSYTLSYLGNGIFEASTLDISHWQAFMLQFSYGVKSAPFLNPDDLTGPWAPARFRFSSGVSIVGPEPLVYLGPSDTSKDLALASFSADIGKLGQAVPEASSLVFTTLAFVAGVFVTMQSRKRSA